MDRLNAVLFLLTYKKFELMLTRRAKAYSSLAENLGVHAKLICTNTKLSIWTNGLHNDSSVVAAPCE